MARGDLDDLLLILPLLHFLVAAHQKFHIVGPLGGLPRLPLHPGSKGAGKAACQQHHQESHRVVWVERRQGKAGDCEEEIEGNNAQQRNQNSIEVPVCPNRCEQNPQQIDDDDVRLAQSQFIKQKARARGGNDEQYGFPKILPVESLLRFVKQRPFFLI